MGNECLYTRRISHEQRINKLKCLLYQISENRLSQRQTNPSTNNRLIFQKKMTRSTMKSFVETQDHCNNEQTSSDSMEQRKTSEKTIFTKTDRPTSLNRRP